MRKPRVYLFNYSGRLQNNLITYFLRDRYELSILNRYERSTIYCEQESISCNYPLHCCDIMVIVDNDEQMKGFVLIKKQYQISCKLTHLNKALISDPTDHEKLVELIDEGITIFSDPLDYIAFGAWVKDCEKRMDISHRLPVIRREVRRACSIPVEFRLLGEDADTSALVVNTSTCGICLRAARPIREGQELIMRSGKAENTEVGIVRWMKKHDDGSYHSGVTFCV